MNFLLIYFLQFFIFCAKVHLQDFNFVSKNNKFLIKSQIKHDFQKYAKNNKNDMDAQDHALTFLTKKTIESCPFGFLPSSTNATDCEPLICHKNLDCETHFGQNTMCGKILSFHSGICQCDKTHTLDAENRCTVEIRNPLDHSCLLEDQCYLWVRNSVCVKKRCKCDLAYQATASGACEKVFCNASQPNQQGRAVCRAHFGENVQCDADNECSCDFNFVHDWKTTGCRPLVSPLGAACTGDQNCSDICLNGQCACKLGSLADASYSRYNCRKVFCSDDRQCRRLFPHTKCYYSYYGCQCDDGAGYETNSSSQRCVLRHQLLGTTCQADGDCGLGAQCLHHNCTCQAAFGPKENKMDCQAIDCRTDAQCQQFGDANSVCSSNGCICRDGYFVNQTLARCAPTDDNTDRRSKYSLTAIVSLIVLCVAVIGMIAFYAVSTQKRKNQARQQQRQQQQQRRQEQQQQQQQKQQY